MSLKASAAPDCLRPKSSASGNPIRVVVRLRDRNERESTANDEVVVTQADSQTVMIKHRKSDKRYTYSSVLGSMHTQADVYQDLAGSIASDLVIGKSNTIMAYGPTGTGKTYTMMGSQRSPVDDPSSLLPSDGLVPRLLFDLFQEIEKNGIDCMVTCQYIEIYNETLRDLLSYETRDSESSIGSRNLRIIEGSDKGTLQGAVERVVCSAPQALSLIANASLKREVAATELNAESSRSHAILTISLTSRPAHLPSQLAFTSRVRLVDLAGSENVGRSKATKERSMEAGQINQSLLALGRVITALAERASHIPFRSSKLTRLLQDALYGGSSTTLIATLSPCSSDVEESINTLEYSSRAALIAPKRGGEGDDQNFTTLKAMGQRIMQLQNEVDMHRQKDGYAVVNTEEYHDLVEKAERESQARGHVKALLEKVVHLQQQIDQLNAENANLTGSLRAAEAAQSELVSLKIVTGQQKAEIQNLSRKVDSLESAAKSSSMTYGQSLQKVQSLLDGERSFTESIRASLEEVHSYSERLVERIEKRSSDLGAEASVSAMRAKQTTEIVMVFQALEQFQAKIGKLVNYRNEVALSELEKVRFALKAARFEIDGVLKTLACNSETSQFQKLSELANRDQRSLQEALANLMADLEQQNREKILMHEKAISDIKASTYGARFNSLADLVDSSFSRIQDQTKLLAEESERLYLDKARRCHHGFEMIRDAMLHAGKTTGKLVSPKVDEELAREFVVWGAQMGSLYRQQGSESIAESAATLRLAKSMLNETATNARAIKTVISSSMNEIDEQTKVDGKRRRSLQLLEQSGFFEASAPPSNKRKAVFKRKSNRQLEYGD